MPLYKIENPFTKASNVMSQAGGTFSRMQRGGKQVTEGPGKTGGGAIFSGLGGAMAGSSIASSIYGSTAAGGAVGGPMGAGIGALIGIGAYLFS